MIVRPARNARSLATPTAAVVLGLSLAACGGDGSAPAAGDEAGPIAADGPLSPVPGTASTGAGADAPGGALAANLLTASSDGDDFDLWFCAKGTGDVDAVGYAFDADGTGTHYKVLGDELGPVTFEWRVAGADAVTLSYPGAGADESLEAIAFGDDAWAGTSSADGALDCTLQAIIG